jgi:hypothetical protein
MGVEGFLMVSTRIPGIRLSSQESAARIMAHPAVCFGLYVDSGAGGRKKKKKNKIQPIKARGKATRIHERNYKKMFVLSHLKVGDLTILQINEFHES